MTVFGAVTVVATIAAGVIGFIASWRVFKARQRVQQYEQMANGRYLEYDNPNNASYNRPRHYQNQQPYGYGYSAEVVDAQPAQPTRTSAEEALLGIFGALAAIANRHSNTEAVANNQTAAPSPVPQPAPVPQPVPMPVPAPAPAPQPMPTTPGIPMNGWDMEDYNDAVVRSRISNTRVDNSGLVYGAINAHGLDYPIEALYDRSVLPAIRSDQQFLSRLNGVCAGYDPRPIPWQEDWRRIPRLQYRIPALTPMPTFTPPAPVPMPTYQPPMPQPIPQPMPQPIPQPVRFQAPSGMTLIPGGMYTAQTAVNNYVPGILSESRRNQQPMYGQQMSGAPVLPVQPLTWHQEINSTYGPTSTPHAFDTMSRFTAANAPMPTTQTSVADRYKLTLEDAINFSKMIMRMQAKPKREEFQPSDAELMANAKPGQEIVLSNGQRIYPYG